MHDNESLAREKRQERHRFFEALCALPMVFDLDDAGTL